MFNTNKKNYAQFRRRLIIGFCLLVVLLILSFAWKIASSYEDDRTTVRIQTKNFVQAMSAQVVGTIQLIDLSLTSTADTIKVLSDNKTLSTEVIKKTLLAGHIPDANFW